MIAAVLEGLLRASLAGSVAVLAVLLFRRLVRQAYGAGIAYRLWIAPPLVALASLLPQVPGLAIPAPEGAGLITPDKGWIILTAWLGGALLLAAAFALVHRRFLRVLGKPSLDEGGLPILRARDAGTVGPAVVGALSARIVLPADFDNRYSALERTMVLAHERTHLFGHDAQAITLAVVLRCLNWFNPLAHLGAYYLRIDQELACDAAVLQQFPQSRRTYAEALVKTQLAGAVPPFGCQWPARGQNPLEQRIELLAAPVRGHGRRTRGAVLVAALIIAGCGVAWTAERPALFVRPPAALELWAGLKDNSAFTQRVRPTPMRSGEAISRNFEVEKGDYWRVTLRPTLQAAGGIHVTADLAHGGETSRKLLVLAPNEPEILRLGDRNLVVIVRKPPNPPIGEEAVL